MPRHAPPFRAIRAAVACTVLAAAVSAQEEKQAPAPAKPVREQPATVSLQYPRDAEKPVAIVGGRAITLRELVTHIDERHQPGFAKAVAERPEIQRMLQSDLMPAWVRTYADVVALKVEGERRKVEVEKVEAAQQTALKRMFQAYLDAYCARLKEQGRPEPSQERVNGLLSDWQLRNGLAAEQQGWLDLLEPDEYPRQALTGFFNDNARAFGGQVVIAHILIRHRHPGTGILLDAAGRARALARVADVRSRLAKDGSNFEQLARLFSEDAKTAPEGGVFDGVHRFDDRLPAVICRTAWSLRDGEISDVVESQYGLHFVKRLDFRQNIFPLLTDDMVPVVRDVMRRSRQEDLLFALRKQNAIQLEV